MPYEMRGQFLEACDCHVPCPCWFEQEPHEGECTGLIAWQIEQGTIDGVDVSGLTAVSISTHGGSRTDAATHAKMRVSLFINEEASQEQEQALGSAFTGKLGGPLAELAQMTEDDSGVERAEIAFSSDGKTTKLTVGRAVETSMTPVIGSTKRITTIGDSILATLLGPIGEVGKADTFNLDLPRDSISIELEGSSATRGRFAYVAKKKK